MKLFKLKVCVCVCVCDLQASALCGALALLWCLCVSGGQQDDVATVDTH